MPSHNPITGKRLGGQDQQHLKNSEGEGVIGLLVRKENAKLEHLPVPEAFQAVCEPPIEDGLEAIERWMQALTLRGVDVFLAEDKTGMPRCLTIQECAKAMIKMRGIAFRAEQAMKVRKLRLGEEDLELVPSEAPLEDPIAAVVYVYHQLARFAFQAATDEEWLPTMKLGAIRQMATTAGLNCPAEIKKVIQRAKEGG